MNLQDLQQIYSAALEVYKKDPELTNIQINMYIKNSEIEKKTAIINVDFRKPNKQQKKIK